jgi:hypothetical protein
MVIFFLCLCHRGGGKKCELVLVARCDDVPRQGVKEIELGPDSVPLSTRHARACVQTYAYLIWLPEPCARPRISEFVAPLSAISRWDEILMLIGGNVKAALHRFVFERARSSLSLQL